MVDSLKNFAYGTVSNNPGLAGTVIDLQAGQGLLFPAGAISVTFWPSGQFPTVSNSEIVRGSFSGDAFNVTQRQAEGSTNVNISSSYQAAQDITAGFIAQILAALVSSLNGLTGALTVESSSLTVTTPGSNVKIEVPTNTYDAYGAAATAQANAEAYALALMEANYPVGKIEINLGANPNTYLAGLSGSTWVLTAQGQFIAGTNNTGGSDPIFGTVGNTGGSVNALIAHTHQTGTDSVNHFHPVLIGSHAHGPGSLSAANGTANLYVTGSSQGYLFGNDPSGGYNVPPSGGDGSILLADGSLADSGHPHAITGGSTDGGQAFNTSTVNQFHAHTTISQSATTSNSLPPYLVLAIWKRTA